MEIIINKEIEISEPTAVALGNFDGLHLGHQQLIKTMIKHAKEREIKSTVFTFYNHTANVVNRKEHIKVLTNLEQKIKILSEIGVELLYIMNFDEKVMHMLPEEFIKKILIDKLNAVSVIVGFNYRFGHNAQGDGKYLKEVEKKFGFNVEIVPPFIKDNNIISSTFIRGLIQKGEVRKANELLGRPYTIRGKVVPGKGRGKIMGIPTANIALSDNYVLPRFGVYKTRTNIDGNTYLSVTNIGQNPTFNNDSISIETYLVDFIGEIYGKQIEVSIFDYIREEKKFYSKDELIKQIKSDIEVVIKDNNYLQK